MFDYKEYSEKLVRHHDNACVQFLYNDKGSYIWYGGAYDILEPHTIITKLGDLPPENPEEFHKFLGTLIYASDLVGSDGTVYPVKGKLFWPISDTDNE